MNDHKRVVINKDVKVIKVKIKVHNLSLFLFLVCSRSNKLRIRNDFNRTFRSLRLIETL